MPADAWSRLRVTLPRAITRRCPYCGAPGIFCDYWSLRDHCPNCGERFEREEGYFLGAFAMNLIVTEFVGLGLVIFLLFRTELRHLELIWQEAIAIAFVVILPIAFFPFARSLWIVLDLTFHPPNRVPERQLRAHQVDRDRESSR